ncbi:metal-sulfur cluster assembly factor [Nanoarchaeota archaeon]
MVTKDDVIAVLKTVMDPELFIDVWTLELIYDISIEGSTVKILMTFTTPLCPYGPQLQEDIRMRVVEIKGIDKCETEVTFNPKWEPSEELRALFGV